MVQQSGGQPCLRCMACHHRHACGSSRPVAKKRIGESASWRGIGNRCDSACALELTRRVAGDSVAVHAGFTYINALTELSCIKLLVTLGDASALLIRVFNILRARRQKDSERRHNNGASQLQGAAFGRMASHKMTHLNRLRFTPIYSAPNQPASCRCGRVNLFRHHPKKW
jgi:hypothetical protein